MTDTHWLDGTERIFGEGAGSLVGDTAFQHDLEAYAHGYRRSAEMLFAAIQQGGYADSQYFALAFLWRQCLELTLKALHQRLLELEHLEADHGSGRRVPPHLDRPLLGHDLQKLWRAVEPRVRSMFPGSPETDWIGRALAQFHAVDPRAEDFRYPMRRSGATATLAALPRRPSFDALDGDMRSLLNVLEGALGETRYRIDCITESLRSLD